MCVLTLISAQGFRSNIGPSAASLLHSKHSGLFSPLTAFRALRIKTVLRLWSHIWARTKKNKTKINFCSQENKANKQKHSYENYE